MSQIPKVIYQSWKTHELYGQMKEAVEHVKKLNPEYKHILYSDADCRKLLLDNFGENYALAFDTLKPGAFKCDFWRYAVLYLYGGIYMDIDMKPVVPFREFVNGRASFISIADAKHFFTPSCNVYQAFIACVPKHPIMKYSLEICFNNIVTRRQDMFENLSVTGPVVVGVAMNLYWKKQKTHDDIYDGEYDNGDIILLRMDRKYTYSLDDKKLIQNTFTGYDRGSVDYQKIGFYTDDPRKRTKQIIKWSVISIIGLVVIGFIVALILYLRLKSCRNSSSNE